MPIEFPRDLREQTPVAPPEEIRVGPFSYLVEFTEEFEAGHVGNIVFSKERIRISPDQSLRQEQDTVLHEAMHAVIRFLGIDLENEEQLVASLTSTLLMVIRDNPALIAYLQRD